MGFLLFCVFFVSIVFNIVIGNIVSICKKINFNIFVCESLNLVFIYVLFKNNNYLFIYV